MIVGALDPRPQFPLKVHSSGRYCVDQAGVPFIFWGDTAWGLINEPTLDDVRYYLADRRARGITSLIMQASNPDLNGDNVESVSPAARGAGMALPYTKNINGTTWTGVLANHDAAFDQPNDIYWNWVDVVLREVLRFGMAAIIDILYWGQSGGWWANLQQAYNTQSICYEHGRYIGRRFQHHPNIIIDMGTDRFPVSGSADSAKFDAIIQGMIDAGCKQLITAHYKRSSDSRDYSDYLPRIGFNSVYPGTGAGNSYTAVYGRMRVAYAKSPAMPIANVEAIYDGDPAGGGAPTRAQLRSFAGWSITSGGGYVFGQRRVEAYEMVSGVPIWKDYLGNDPTLDHQRTGVFIKSLPWHLLVPDGLGSIGTLITAGGGSSQTVSSVGTNGTTATADVNNGLDKVTAAATPDGSTLLVYRPPNHSGTFTIDRTKLRGTMVQRWFDPTTGNYTSVGADQPNTGTQVMTPPSARGDGSSDIYLRCDA
jgi:hypothetical protein